MAEPVFGKKLIRLAKGMQTNEDVVLKFYDDPELYSKSLSLYDCLNMSTYICKCVLIPVGSPKKCDCHIRPIDKIEAHQGFPNCLVFAKGMHTLDEWLRIPDIDVVNKKETLKLVMAPPIPHTNYDELLFFRW